MRSVAVFDPDGIALRIGVDKEDFPAYTDNVPVGSAG
jgi:hypothetical protein